ncbi:MULTISPECIES: divergent polysaccharide deacetylase family protein [Edwardsiella]|uniref:Putative divergent polysaccharide deacetylase n=1 Tax=Edwardsiella anguillarum ET080813 TaxID=667120 RepID=A0A076LJK1_9GAMM|nr:MULTISPECIES: divergent polysaccharide deacetylase family protein [Edwardsiella]AIJ08131.1 putative divergent polysaccharide deacetylase [Edwardsiella anguillarum ET080813]AKR79191.1 divergent polysaccharide deacetylase family protein [Edwardsiella sp. LADL05-105]KAB0591958.1 divergent polysaccharide deacetylase family protein [Edwardsiella anguillarum]UOU79117.1 divergent polysaccharide deacetylase family protein [Edwardsiella anguillarum]WHQ14169.1 divergent polysaccharide deacetylase fam
MRSLIRLSSLALLCSALAAPALAGKLAIVIDDFGYRPREENQVLEMPLPVTIAVLPNAPHAREMALRAHAQGREILIHLPMAPLSKQPLERDTLQPAMSEAEIQRIIRQAVGNVPYAVGMNNHMGSAMTSSLTGMQKVMRALEQYNLLYFLDSMTIGHSQVSNAAQGTGIKVIKRKVFLDDAQSESAIRTQFNRAITLARRNGSAIAIGHPHPATVRVLQQMLRTLPSDITLVRPSALLNEAARPDPVPLVKPAHPPLKRPTFGGIRQCRVQHASTPVHVSQAWQIVAEGVRDTEPVKWLQARWRFWLG